MKHIMRHAQTFLRLGISGMLLAPALALAHVATDTPVARQLYCYLQPDFWNGKIKDAGCKELELASGTYAGMQWNEVAKLIDTENGDDYNDQSTVERLIPDGKLCSAADPRKDGLNRPSPNWHKTPVTPVNGKLRVRIPGTAPHDNMIVKIYLTKTGFNPATSVLKWSDLDELYSNTFPKAQTTNWGSPPPSPALGLNGFFAADVPIPANRSGNAILFVRAQRTDPKGEGFYNCSDITIQTANRPVWFLTGAFQPHGFNPALGDSVHFRVLSPSKSFNEIVDIKHPITTTDASVWGRELVNKLAPYNDIVKVGELIDDDIVFNPTNQDSNRIYVASEGNSTAMSIIPGGGQTPVNPTAPVACITGPTSLKSGQAFTFDGSGSSGSNGPLLYQWAVPGMEGSQSGSTVSGKALTVQTVLPLQAQLNIRDQKNGKTSQATFDFNVTPGSGGGTHPDYKEGNPYNAGDIVTNNGKNYQCKPWPYTAWCAGSKDAYAPGTGRAWQQAWDEVQ